MSVHPVLEVLHWLADNHVKVHTSIEPQYMAELKRNEDLFMVGKMVFSVDLVTSVEFKRNYSEVIIHFDG